MKVVYSKEHQKHDPPYEFFNGTWRPYSESPSRLNKIKSEIDKHANLFEVIAPDGFKDVRRFIEDVHTKDYVSFLKNASEHANSHGDAVEGQKRKVLLASVFPLEKFAGKTFVNKTRDIMAQNGAYAIDNLVPITKTTYEACLSACRCALTAAKLLLDGKERVAYCLSRPPGHHAGKSYGGGFCFLNGNAVAANYLAKLGNMGLLAHLRNRKKVAVLDIDIHHGNGTQDIFYERDDVFFASIHEDPNFAYPYYTGYADENGNGVGKNHNLNIPLPREIGNKEYAKALDFAIENINQFSPDFLVITLGVDTRATDPIGRYYGGFKLTVPFFKEMAEKIKANLDVPTLIHQEGGYLTDDLGEVVVSFLSGYL